MSNLSWIEEMKKYLNKSVFAALIIVLIPISLSAQDHYERGKKELDAGNWSQALNIWRNGINQLTIKGEVDPRIGTSFIEVVTKEELRHFYGVASDFYFWGLSDNTFDKYPDAIGEEVARLLPLLEETEQQIWEDMVDNRDPELFIKIREFWIKKDPTPISKANERLLEHWERIAFARRNFSLSDSPPYYTDDRGIIYVRFGKPRKKQSGQLGTNNAELRIWADKIIEAVRSKMNTQVMPIAIHKVGPNANQLANMIRYDDKMPSYEVWNYAFPGLEDYAIYVFGSIGGSGRFRIVNSLEDLIPNSAFSKSHLILVHNESGDKFEMILPGSVLQLTYYEKLIPFSPVFARRYEELSFSWENAMISGSSNTTPNHQSVKAKRNSYISQDKNDPVKMDAPDDKSDFDEVINKVDMIASQFRFLNNMNDPQIAFVCVAVPVGMVGKYNLTNSILVYDSNWNEVNRLTDGPKYGGDNISSFVMDHKDGSLNYVAASNADAEEGEKSEEYFIGKMNLEKIPPLSTDYSRLEISDMITGIRVTEAHGLKSYPFPVMPVKQFSKNDQLDVYVEMYHLSLGSDGKAHYDIEFSYEIVRKRRFRSDRVERLSQKQTFDSLTQVSHQTVAFDLNDMTPGEYDFTVEVTDIISGHKKTRTGKLVILENKEKN
ncbi:MAG: GWxTD domain-containing protein [bacterium]|nr:GWxTD domain-containing protein [bacterium]